MKSKEALDLLERVREIVGSLPEVEEIVDGHGHDVFKVNGKSFILLGQYEGPAGLCFKADKEQQYLLLQQGKYEKPPFLGQHGWCSVAQVASPDWEELRDLLREAYLRVAPKRLVKRVLEEEA